MYLLTLDHGLLELKVLAPGVTLKSKIEAVMVQALKKHIQGLILNVVIVVVFNPDTRDPIPTTDLTDCAFLKVLLSRDSWRRLLVDC